MSSSESVRPVIGQRIVVQTIYTGAEKRFLATSLGIPRPFLAVHFLRDKPRRKVLRRAIPWREPKIKLIHEKVTSATKITVLKPDPNDPTGQLAENQRIPDAHLRYFTPVDSRECGGCGSREILKITRYRQTAEVCRACNAVQPKPAEQAQELQEAERFAAVATAVCGFGSPNSYLSKDTLRGRRV